MLTFYTSHFVPVNAAGCMRVFFIPLIFIRPEYKDDKGLLEHERLHAKQAWRCLLPTIHAIMYALNKTYRLQCEVECYREQAKHYPDDRRALFAKFIAEEYGLSISPEEAHRMLVE